VGKLFKEKARRKLSQTAVETLAIIAYKQPITKSEIEFIRGVNADYIMKTLLEKNLATITGRAHSPGRPLLYGTTPEFLKHFGLNEITDLPKPREIEELLGETELEVEKRMLANQEELEFKEKLHEKLDPNSRAPHIPRKKSKLQEQQPENEGKTVIEKATPLPPLPRPQEKVENDAVVNAGSDVYSPTDEKAETTNGITGQTLPTPEDDSAKTMNDLTDHPVESGRTEPVETPPLVSAVEAGIEQPPLSLPEIEKIEERSDSVLQSIPDPETAVSNRPPVVSSTAWEHQETNESKKGWSTWKTKIQTFFRKLFG